MDVNPHINLLCPHCPSDSLRRFTKRGLSIHITRKHRPTATVGLTSPTQNPRADEIDPVIVSPDLSLLEGLGNIRANVHILKHIPKGARNLAAGRLNSIIVKCLQTNAPNDWYALLSFAYSALRVPEDGDSSKSLTSKVRKNIGDTFDFLPSQKPRRTPSIYKLIETKVFDGDFRGAVRLLTSECTLAASDPATLGSLREKHPSPVRPMSYSPASVDCLQVLKVTSKDVMEAIASFHCSSAAGLDGLRPQHLKELVSISAGDNGPRLLKSLTDLCNFLLEGKLCGDVCPFLYGASLCALRKKDGGIRPIAVGSVIRRLVAKLGCRAVRDKAAELLQPYQLGFGTPRGCEAAIHATRIFAMDPQRGGNIIVKIDLKNAFNSLERGAMLVEARDKIPLLSPFLDQCYVCPSNLYFNGHKITSQMGAQQGDPLGPLLFSLTINQIIATLGAPLNVWYLDDGTIGGDPDIVTKDLELLILRLRDIGLTINSAKCELYRCGTVIEQNIERIRNILPDIKIVDQQTFELLGAPVFENGLANCLRTRRRALASARQHLPHLSGHVALTLYRSCLSVPKLMYVLRTCPTWLVPDEVDALDSDIKDALETILNIHLDDNQWVQASLPIRHGGLGVRRVRDVSVSAFLASAHGVAELVTNILQLQGDSSAIPYAAEALRAWSLLCPAADQPENPSVQRQWDERVCAASFAELLHSARGVDLARLKSVSTLESGAWLHAIPSPHLGTLLDDGSLRVAVALRVGSKIVESHVCMCGVQVDATGHHGLSCGRSAGRFPRHHMLNEVIRRALVSAGLPSTLEPPGLSRSDGKRPDGLTLVPWEKGRCLLWDATCVSTYAASHLTRTSRRAGSAAEWAAIQKHHKYATLERAYFFVPFAVEVSGVWCAEAKDFVRELGRRLRRNGQDHRAESFLVQHISLAIQRGNVASIMGTFSPGMVRGGFFD